MKHHKEWCKEVRQGSVYCPEDWNGLFDIESFVKAIQLDAWKQGMNDAAQTLDHWHEGYTYNADDFQEAQRLIREEAKEKSEL